MAKTVMTGCHTRVTAETSAGPQHYVTVASRLRKSSMIASSPVTAASSCFQTVPESGSGGKQSKADIERR